MYSVMLKMLDDHYKERTITIMLADPPYVTLYVKSMLRWKNRLMRSAISNADEQMQALSASISVSRY